MMDGSDKKYDALKKVLVAKKAAKDKNKGDVIPQGPRSKSNPFVDVNDPKGNVAKYGRKFTAPKGKTGTSYTIPSKKKGMK
jgi:hypothetical protein